MQGWGGIFTRKSRNSYCLISRTNIYFILDYISLVQYDMSDFLFVSSWDSHWLYVTVDEIFYAFSLYLLYLSII